MFDSLDFDQLLSVYLIPWGINLMFALAIFLIGRFVVGILVGLFARVMARTRYEPMLIAFLQSILGAALTLVVIIAALDRLGVDTTSLVAIIGAAGLAIGLSLQGSLKNFAAGVLLLIFKPFKAGDYVEAGGTAGTVHTIGIFNSIIITPDNKEIIVPNANIYDRNIVNWSAKETRRVDLVVGIGYDADLRKAKALLQQMLSADERILQEPAPLVAVAELADSSVNFNVRPWVKTSDFWPVKYDLTEKIKLTFDEQGISIPFPQMDVHLHKNDNRKANTAS